jgi:hypothetical protein
VWEKDRIFLDLQRPLPPGSVTPDELQRINPDLFLAFNLIQCRWEVWCDRARWCMSPYFVFRCVTHPPNRVDGGKLVTCPGRPPRSANSPACPPSCRGKYEIPDRRLLGVLYRGSVVRQAEGAEDQVEALELLEDVAAAAKTRYAKNELEAIVSDKFNQLVGIEQVGYTGKEK